MILSLIETRFGIVLKRVGPHEWAGPLPHCGGEDRFHFWDDRLNWWCRPGPGHCGQQGFPRPTSRSRKADQENNRSEWRLQALERQQREQEERLSRLERMHKCTDHLRYHQALTDEAREYWWAEGITDESIARYLLGYCSSCPTDQEKRPSYTIPVINDGHLENIRHRLKDVTADKYRPHMAGLGVQAFQCRLPGRTPCRDRDRGGGEEEHRHGAGRLPQRRHRRQTGVPAGMGGALRGHGRLRGPRSRRPRECRQTGGVCSKPVASPGPHRNSARMKVDDMIVRAQARGRMT